MLPVTKGVVFVDSDRLTRVLATNRGKVVDQRNSKPCKEGKCPGKKMRVRRSWVWTLKQENIILWNFCQSTIIFFKKEKEALHLESVLFFANWDERILGYDCIFGWCKTHVVRLVVFVLHLRSHISCVHCKKIHKRSCMKLLARKLT